MWYASCACQVTPLSAGLPSVTCSPSSDATAFRIYCDTFPSSQTVHLIHFKPKRQTSKLCDTDDMERVSLKHPVAPVPHGCATQHPAPPFAASKESLHKPSSSMIANSSGASCVDRSIDRAGSKRRNRVELAFPFDLRTSSAHYPAWNH